MFIDSRCQIIGHQEQQIIGICTNSHCRQQSRRICLKCYEMHMNDRFYKPANIKDQNALQDLIDEFINKNQETINNIFIQCQRQKYLLNLEHINFIELQNQKHVKLMEIIQQIQQFDDKYWNSINLFDYFTNYDKDISIQSYLQQFQSKIIKIDNIKDDYILNQSKQQFSVESLQEIQIQSDFQHNLLQHLKKNNDILLNNVFSNSLFIQKQRDDNPFITMFEIALQEGIKHKYLGSKLRTFNVNQQFSGIHHLIQNIKDYELLYIQSLQIVNSQGFNQSTIKQQQVLDLLNDSIYSNSDYHKPYLLKGIQIYIFIANILTSLNKNSEALNIINHAIDLDKNCSEAYYLKAQLLSNLGRNQEALEQYDKVIKLNPTYTSTYFNKAILLEKLKKYSEAIDLYEKVIRLDPKFNDAYINLGFKLNIVAALFEKQKFFEDSIIVQQEAIQVNERNPLLYHNLGNNLLKQEIHFQICKDLIKLQQCLIKQQNWMIRIQFFMRAKVLEEKYLAKTQIKLGSKRKLQLHKKLQKIQKLVNFNSKIKKVFIFNNSKNELDDSQMLHKDQLKFQTKQINQQRQLGNQKALKLSQSSFCTKVLSALIIFLLFFFFQRTIQIMERQECSLVLNNIALKLQQHNLNEEIINIYHKSIELNSNNETIHINLSNLYLSKGSYLKAINQSKEAINLNSSNFEPYFQLGLSLQNIGQLEDSIPYFDQAIQLNPHNALTFYQKGTVYHNPPGYALQLLGNHNDAIQMLKNVIKLDSEYYLFKIFKEYHTKTVDMFDQAKQYNQSYLDAQINKGIFILNAAYSLQALQKYISAIYECDQALKLDNQNVIYKYRLGNSLFFQKEYDNAIEEFEKSLKLDPENLQGIIMKGRCFQSKGNQKIAIQLFDKAIQLNPLESNSYIYKGVSCFLIKRLEDAHNLLDKAITLDPLNALAYREKGNIYYKQKVYKDAITYYLQALQINPQNVDLYSKLGELYKREEDFIKSREYYMKSPEYQKKQKDIVKIVDDLKQKID
ncbi:hypothetical protein pb186bvf_019005 [Paramecium bursaria]